MTLIYSLIYDGRINFVLRNINYFLKSLLPKQVKIPPSGVLKIKTNSGKIKIDTNQTSYLTHLLFWYGYRSFEYSEIIEQLSREVTSFFDIGANIGYYSLLATKSNPKIKVYAFEPAFGPKYYLKKNIELNGMQKNITAIDYAISNLNGVLNFYEVKSVKYKSLIHNLAGEGNAGTKTKSRNFIKTTVNAQTLSAFINSNNIEKIDLIKIDTEGTEVDILNSGKQHIKKFQPIVICETLFNTIENELDDYFDSLNYLKFNHTKKGLVKVDSIKRTVDNGIRNCFFVPKSKIDLISHFIVTP